MRRSAVMLLGITSMCTGLAFAQSSQVDRAIKYRQGIMTAQSWNAGIMGAMIKGERPYDKDEFLRRAMNLDQLVKWPWEGYIPGSDQSPNTRAKPEIWKEQAKFTQYGDRLQAETAKLVAAAKTGDLNQVKGPFGDVGKICSGCHDDFRKN
jgi:cytochrome c556